MQDLSHRLGRGLFLPWRLYRHADAVLGYLLCESFILVEKAAMLCSAALNGDTGDGGGIGLVICIRGSGDGAWERAVGGLGVRLS